MSYVKISDPAIIDLAGVQQIISVVNQHSDYLNVLINRFGVTQIPDWEGDSTQNIYDPATSVMAYGKETIKSTDNDETPGGKTFYKISVDYNGAVFSQKPYITLTLDNSDGNENTQLDFILSVHNVTTTGFTIRAMRAGVFSSSGQPKYTIDNNIKVNWMAVGPR
jgi:hypothetical protein